VLLLTGHTLKDSDYTIAYHKGELLQAEEMANASDLEQSEHNALRRPPMVMEADLDVVLRTLEQEMKAPAGLGV
jgi:threonine synthase